MIIFTSQKAQTMKKILIIFVFATAFVFGSVYTLHSATIAKNFPDYETVVREFFGKYDVIEYLEYSDVAFAKQSDGWYYNIVNYGIKNPKEGGTLFWSVKTGKFVKLDLPRVKEKSDNDYYVDKCLSDNLTVHCYNYCPYYGYVGWDSDVIRDFTDFNSNSDIILYGMARAYSQYASDMIVPNSYGPADHNFRLETSSFLMTDLQLAEYINYQSKAVKLYKRVSEINPAFKTIVGDCQTKYANESNVMAFYISVFNDGADAYSILLENLYDEHFLSIAKNYLNSCDQNSILLTYGDNDFFPLLYLQNKHNFRTDVLVVCIPFLSSEWYLSYLMTKNIHGGKLNLKMDYSFYSDPVSAVVYNLSEPIDSSASVEVFLENLLLEDNRIMDYELGEYLTFHEPKILLQVDKGKIVQNKIVNAENSVKIVDNIEIVMDQSYLLRGDLVILDIIRSNDWSRSLFSTSIYFNSLPNLNKYLESKGVAYKFVPVYSEETFSLNTSDQYDFLMNDLSWCDIEKLPDYKVESFKTNMLIISFRKRFANLAIQLYNEGDSVSAQSILRRCENLYPSSKFAPTIYDLDFVNALALINEMEKAETFLNLIAYPIIDELQILSKMSAKERGNNKVKIENDLIYLDYFTSFAFDMNFLDAAIYYQEYYSKFSNKFGLKVE
jgi:hypothetical protein